MNIKDAYIHVGPSGTNEKALLKDFAITAALITLTRAILNDAGTGDKTETFDVPTWNLNTTGSAGSLSVESKDLTSGTASNNHYLTFVSNDNATATNEKFYTTADVNIKPSTGALTANKLFGKSIRPIPFEATPTTAGWYRIALVNEDVQTAQGFIFLRCASNSLGPETHVFLVNCTMSDAEITQISGKKRNNAAMCVTKVRVIPDHYTQYRFKYVFDFYYDISSTGNTKWYVSTIGDFEALEPTAVSTEVGNHTYDDTARTSYELNLGRGVIAYKFTGDVTGNATTASALSVVKSTAATTHYLTFVDSNNDSAANENFYTTANISITPSTGTLKLINTTAPALIINNTNSATNHDCGILFLRSGTVKGWVGYRADHGMYLYNSTRLKYLEYKDDGTLLFETNKVWHAGNDGPDSGLNADLLDGQHLSDLDARYVLISGDTMTGALTVPSLSVTGAATFSQAINGDILGNATTASRLQNARTIELTGSIIGSGTFDGSGNLSIATTTNHSHSQYLPLEGGTMTGDITMTNGKGIVLTNYTEALSFTSNDRTIPFALYQRPGTIGYTSSDSSKGLTFNPNTGELKSGSFVKRGGTSSQFLKADGSVDSNTYLTSTTAVTNWEVKSDDANYPIAFSPNVTPSASNNAYNTGFTFNPGTKTFNNNGCRLQYDSINKVLKFIFV